MSSYQISQVLEPSHAEDVKAILAINDDCVASGSRDRSVGIWRRDRDGDVFELRALLGGHDAYVNSLAHIPTEDEKEGLGHIASGGNSSLILLHSLDTLSPEPTSILIGHALNVCTLGYSRRRRRLISGSWDKTARIWVRREPDSGEPEPVPAEVEAGAENGGEIGRESRENEDWKTELVLEGHEEAVWGVAIVDEGPKEGCYLTADRLINLWDDKGQCILRIKGSPEPVRSLSVLPDGQHFASACNDGRIRVWDYGGSVRRVYTGHTDYVYDVVSRDQGLISCGEDHTARTWDEDGSTDKLLHPCQTVWCVDSLPNGDIITGGSDGRVRIWSRDQRRHAAADVQQAYEAEVQAVMAAKPQDEQQELLDGENGNPAAESRSLTIDIDTSDDADPIPLTYNFGEDPASVARRFGEEHSLSENYIGQITSFIELHLQQLQPSLSLAEASPKDERLE